MVLFRLPSAALATLLSVAPAFATDHGTHRAAATPRVFGIASPGHTQDCRCRAAGISVQVGQSVCLSTPAGQRLATCGMVLNNTSWEFSNRPCPQS